MACSSPARTATTPSRSFAAPHGNSFARCVATAARHGPSSSTRGTGTFSRRDRSTRRCASGTCGRSSACAPSISTSSSRALPSTLRESCWLSPPAVASSSAAGRRIAPHTWRSPPTARADRRHRSRRGRPRTPLSPASSSASWIGAPPAAPPQLAPQRPPVEVQTWLLPRARAAARVRRLWARMGARPRAIRRTARQAALPPTPAPRSHRAVPVRGSNG